MTAKFYLAGHEGFYNRGCEALVRSIVQILRPHFGQCEFLVPSNDLEFDRGQWPEAREHGVRFVPFPKFPEAVRWWSRLYRVSPSLASRWVPMPDLPDSVAGDIAGCDAVIVTGGDVLSLDYSAGSLLRWVAQANAALERRVPVVLWSSSIGPFTRNPRIESLMVEHLRRYALLSTRESHSQAYLQGLSFAQSVQTVDPAFVLRPEPLDSSALMPPQGANGTLGFNVSPVLARARGSQGGVSQLEDAILQFWREVLDKRDMNIALIPHVDSVAAKGRQSDSTYMRGLLDRFGDQGGRIRVLPNTLNAPQLKTLLGSCRYFIGARTHATIGALSCGVPTLSIAYSVKARGINSDLFGDLRYMVETPDVSNATLSRGLDRLIDEDVAIRKLLAQRIPLWKERAAATGQLVAECLAARVAERVAA